MSHTQTQQTQALFFHGETTVRGGGDPSVYPSSKRFLNKLILAHCLTNARMFLYICRSTVWPCAQRVHECPLESSLWAGSGTMRTFMSYRVRDLDAVENHNDSSSSGTAPPPARARPISLSHLYKFRLPPQKWISFAHGRIGRYRRCSWLIGLLP